MTCGQVWWPILGISALHLTHPCTHTPWTHTHTVNTHTLWTHTAVNTHTQWTHTHSEHTHTVNTHTLWTHTAVNTHTQWTHTYCEHTHSSEHTPGAVGSHLCCGVRGAVGCSASCSRAPQSWYWGWRESCTFTPPHLQFLPDLRLEPSTFRLRVRLSNH